MKQNNVAMMVALALGAAAPFTASATDGTLAGSTSPLLYCARTALKNGFTLRDVIRFACENPARLMKLRRGRLAKGYDADFIVTDDSLSKIVSVYIDGNLYE